MGGSAVSVNLSDPPHPLQGQVAVVTGAAQGLGRGIAESLAGAGAAVIIADLQREKAEAAAAQIAGDGRSAAAARLDVTDRIIPAGLAHGQRRPRIPASVLE